MATVTITRPHQIRLNYETASWYTIIELVPGEYEVVDDGKKGCYGHPLRRARVDAVIVDEHCPSSFGGVQYGAGSKENIGKKTTHWIGDDYYESTVDGIDPPFAGHEWATYNADNKEAK